VPLWPELWRHPAWLRLAAARSGLGAGVICLICLDRLISSDRLKLFAVFANQGGAHPVIQMGSAARAPVFLFAEGLVVVVGRPTRHGDGRRKNENQASVVVAGGAGFAAQRVVEGPPPRPVPWAVTAAQQRHHGARRG